jgi:hypothetical protein
MNIITTRTRVCLFAVASGLLLFDGVRAQETTFRGHVVDAQGQPVPSLTVSLHRVTRTGGAVTMQALSGRKGEFAFQIPRQNPADDAVFFVATGYLGQLYLGQPFREPIPAAGDYTIVVGPGGVTASGVLRPTAAPAIEQPPATLSTRSVVLLLAITFGTLSLLAAAFAGKAPERARRQRRAVLLQLARLEEQQAQGAAQDTDLQRRRDELFRRIHSMSR